jgi:hypothetical protein
MFFEMSGTTHAMKQHHIPEDLNPQSYSGQHHAVTYGVSCTYVHAAIQFLKLIAGMVNVVTDVKL